MSRKSKHNLINSILGQIQANVTPLLPVENAEGRWGFATPGGKVMIPHKWRLAGHFYEGLAKVVNDSGKCGFIDKSGELVIPYNFGCSSHFCGGLCWVKGENGLFGFIDKTGNLVIPYRWKAATAFFNHSAAVMDNNDLWHIIGCDGSELSFFSWKKLIPLRNGYYLGKKMDDSWELDNEHGNINDIDSNKNNTFKLPMKYENGKWGFAEINICLNNQSEVSGNSNRLFTATDDGGYVINCDEVSIKSKPLIAGQWIIARSFKEGLARVMDENGKWGYVDERGELVIPCRWIDAGPFWGGSAEVEDAELGEVTIDHSGNII